MNLSPRAKREVKGLGEYITSSEARVLEILVNLPARAKREVKGLGEPITSSEARGLGLF